MSKSVFQNLTNRIRQAGLLQPGGRYVLALSGGCDSLSLLFLLRELSAEEGYHLLAVHVNHGLRHEAAEDEAFCVSRCASLGVPLIVYREQVARIAAEKGLGWEECGRLIRYEALSRAAGLFRADAVLTAHHQDDQAETLVLQLLRGSGLPGLKGMSGVSRSGHRVPVIRPLLGTPQQELEACLREREIGWREDASNQDISYSRNYIRGRLLPAFEARFPGAGRHIAAAASHLEEMHGYMERQASQWVSEYKQGDILPLVAFRDAHPALRYYIWRNLLEAQGLKDLGQSHYDALKNLPEASSGTLLCLPGGRRVLREQESIRLLWDKQEIDEADIPPTYSIRSFPWEPHLKIPDTPYTKWMDYAIISDDLCLRHRQNGDYFYLDGERKKSLARFFVDNKVPLGLRDRLWVLARGSHVLWILGYRLCYSARIKDDTQRVAQLQIFPEGEDDERTYTETLAD